MRPIPTFAIAATILCTAVGAFAAGEFPILNGRLQSNLAAGSNTVTEVRRIWLLDHLNNTAMEVFVSNGTFYVNGSDGAPLRVAHDAIGADSTAAGAVLRVRRNDGHINEGEVMMSTGDTTGGVAKVHIEVEDVTDYYFEKDRVSLGGKPVTNLTMDAGALTGRLLLAQLPHETTLSGTTSSVPTSAAVSNRVATINRLVYSAAISEGQPIPDTTGTNVVYDIVYTDVYSGGDAYGFYHFNSNHVGKQFEVVTKTSVSSGAGAGVNLSIVEEQWDAGAVDAPVCGFYGLDTIVQMSCFIAPTNGGYVGMYGAVDAGGNGGEFDFANSEVFPFVCRTNATMIQIFERQ